MQIILHVLFSLDEKNEFCTETGKVNTSVGNNLLPTQFPHPVNVSISVGVQVVPYVITSCGYGGGSRRSGRRARRGG